jgi:exodeoxyribonuclease VII small subunit
METTNNYLENYSKLNEIAKNLDSNEVIDIDKVLPQIENATQAYSVCMERIREVRALLERSRTEDE